MFLYDLKNVIPQLQLITDISINTAVTSTHVAEEQIAKRSNTPIQCQLNVKHCEDSTIFRENSATNMLSAGMHIKGYYYPSNN
ncbi:MAG: hypothetical protein FKGGLIKP_00326 [Sodalis sp. Fse]|nr:MAG: hypothetical protein FKGGLIKP_00326 [Sodalis sp. Fse]